MRVALLFVILFAAVLSVSASRLRAVGNAARSSGRISVHHAPRSPTTVWSACEDVPVLGEACASVALFPNNLTLVLTVAVRNFTLFTEQLSASQICADDTTLLMLLDKIPALLPFKPIILALIAAHKIIPFNVFHECAIISNLTINSQSASGCVALDSDLMCFKDGCLYKGVDDIGCFNIRLPHAEEKTQKKKHRKQQHRKLRHDKMHNERRGRRHQEN